MNELSINNNSEVNNFSFEKMTPKQIVASLDQYIIGQNKAKRSVAIALRNRQRRLKLEESLRDEIAPKNILMIGPTGVGKTEIARRLAKLCGAPFIKVEATKYTEVGYVGRDVESMIRDLMNASVGMVKQEMEQTMKGKAEQFMEERLLDLLLPGSLSEKNEKTEETIASENSTREKFRTMLREGKLEDRMVDVQIQKKNTPPMMEIFAGTNFDDIGMGMANLSDLFSGQKKSKSNKKHITVKQARDILLTEEAEKLVDNDLVVEEAKKRVEEMGIVFIDEIDKIATTGESSSNHDVSREGVQRDILPIVEGSTVNTKYGQIDTSHILFIAAGAFTLSKPSDLIPELQGRFPLRVELDSLNASDFKKILLEPKNALVHQYVQLMKTENVTLEFSDDSIERMSVLAQEANDTMENIGARRLHTIMEMLLEELSFNAPDMSGQTVTVTKEYVDEKLSDIVQNQDLSQYIL